MRRKQTIFWRQNQKKCVLAVAGAGEELPEQAKKSRRRNPANEEALILGPELETRLQLQQNRTESIRRLAELLLPFQRLIPDDYRGNGLISDEDTEPEVEALPPVTQMCEL